MWNKPNYFKEEEREEEGEMGRQGETEFGGGRGREGEELGEEGGGGTGKMRMSASSRRGGLGGTNSPE